MPLRNAFLAALCAGLAATSMQAGAARVASLPGSGVPLPAGSVPGAPGNLGILASVDSIREDRPLHQLRVKLDSGDVRTVVQERLNDVRVGDRVAIEDGQVYRHDTRADRIDRWGYWVDANGNRYDDIGLRVDDE
jgi:hypothetical protein